MSKIDLDKFICSLIEKGFFTVVDVKNALKDQGLLYKDGQIVPIEEKLDTIKFDKIEDETEFYTESELCRMSPFELCKILDGHTDRVTVSECYADLIDDKKTYRMYKYPRIFGMIGYYDAVQFTTGKRPYISIHCGGKDPFIDENDDEFTTIVYGGLRDKLLRALIDGILRRQIKKD